MSQMFYCRFCKDYYQKSSYNDHMNQHKSEQNIDAVEHKQYTGNVSDKNKDDYMICVLHQKKVPCGVKDCKYQPFGMIRKSWMMKCAKGIIGADDSHLTEEEKKHYLNSGIRHVEPFFPFSDSNSKQVMIPIDMKTKTVVLLGCTIHLRI